MTLYRAQLENARISLQCGGGGASPPTSREWSKPRNATGERESVMPGQVNIQPEPFEFEAESEWEGEAVAPQTLPVRARILWPALGFPAVIAPRKDGSTDAGAGNPSRCICALILSDKQY